MSNNSTSKPLIILTAGGTGGHVFPAESLAEELSARGYELALVTDSRGKDNYHGKLGEITNYSVWAGALVGKSKWFKIKSLFKTGIGVLQAAKILLKRKPVCVVGFGGYASFPCSMAAILLGIDLVIHEQNSVMSRTNRFLSKYASFIAQSFHDVKFTPSRTPKILTGMPIRQNIVALKDREYKTKNTNGKFQLLVIGGSQGAKIFGEVIPDAIRNLSPENQQQMEIYHQCRKEDIEDVKKRYDGCQAQLTVSHFFENMADLYAETGLIISRAGASSIAEIMAAKLPSIIIPLPTAADDHQTTNAESIAKSLAGHVFNQKEFTAGSLKNLLTDLINNPDKLTIMSTRVGNLSITDASQRLANAIEKEIITGGK